MTFPGKKNGQAWGIDLMFAATMLIIGIVIFYFYSINYPTEGADTLALLEYDGKIITDSLLSEGYPNSWTQEDVVTIGLLSDNKINETKLENFYYLSQGNYSKKLIINKH
jgi:hypothetical protein